MLIAPRTFSHQAGSAPSHKRQLRRDRITAVIIVIVALAAFVWAMWAASFGNGGGEGVNDYWHMMP